VLPYVRRPVPPVMCLLDAEGRAISEHGELVDLDDPPANHRVFAGWETVARLVDDGHGEALCWRSEEIRWRETQHPEEPDWKRRPGDVYVLRLPGLDELDPAKVLRGLTRWRDWLAEFGAAPTGTTGSTSMSLLRARLEGPLQTGSMLSGEWDRPPILQTLGGRQELGPKGQGQFRGELVQVDMEAAYAQTLGGLRYGWAWQKLEPPEAVKLGEDGLRPVFIRAKVRIPALQYGPLPRRPRFRTKSYLEADMVGADYPTGLVLQGVWTLQELETAERAGCSVKMLDAWVHRSASRPFLPWWEAVEQGRRMRGLGGSLAKMTGNALWGRFAADVRTGGTRAIKRRNGEVRLYPLPSRPQPWPAHDLAETVSGRVRARLYERMLSAGDHLISAHTDGLWAVGKPARVEGWRTKQRASRLDLLGPQTLRYWPEPAPPWLEPFEPVVVYAGVVASQAPERFQRNWEQAGFGE
jgi:hypothetical protein